MSENDKKELNLMITNLSLSGWKSAVGDVLGQGNVEASVSVAVG